MQTSSRLNSACPGEEGSFLLNVSNIDIRHSTNILLAGKQTTGNYRQRNKGNYDINNRKNMPTWMASENFGHFQFINLPARSWMTGSKIFNTLGGEKNKFLFQQISMLYNLLSHKSLSTTDCTDCHTNLNSGLYIPGCLKYQ